MSRILLVTDSNFVNNVGEFRGRKIKNLEVKSCQTRREASQEISGPSEGIVVVACLDMIAADVTINTRDFSDVERAVEHHLAQLHYKLTERVDDSDGKVAFGVVAPLFWTSHSKEARKGLNHAFKTMKETATANVWCSESMRDVKAGADGVHLTRNSGNKYIEAVQNFIVHISRSSGIGSIEFLEPTVTQPRLSWADEMAEEDPEAVFSLTAPDADAITPTRPPTMQPRASLTPSRVPTMLPIAPLTTSPSILDMSMPGSATAQDLSLAGRTQTQQRLLQLAGALPDLSIPPPTAPLDPSLIARLERRIGKLEAKAFYDNLTMALLKEEQDTEANKAMLNRVTFSGLNIEGLERMLEPDRIKAMREKVGEVIDLVKAEGQVYEILFVKHLNRHIRGAKTAVIEVKLKDEKQTKDLRAEFVKKRKSLDDKINITPVVRLTTRVRVEMMHSIAAVLKREDPTVTRAQCLQFVPKPVIKIVRKTEGGLEVVRTMSFGEAIGWVKVNGHSESLDLKKARERAGAKFRGTMAQNFVLME